jgi:hypothetical protein
MRFNRYQHDYYNWTVQGNYKLKLKSLAGYFGPSLSIYDCDRKQWATLEAGGWLTIYDGYPFDGCTGAPDFKRALRGCCVHDVLLRIRYLYPMYLKISDADNAFDEIMLRDQFFLRSLYSGAVRLYRKIKELL